MRILQFYIYKHLHASMRNLFTACVYVIWSHLERNFVSDRDKILSTCFLIVIQLLQNYKDNLTYLR